MCFKIIKIYLSGEPDKSNLEERQNFNTDVIVLMEEEDDDGNNTVKLVKYVASFFTYTNLFDLRARHIKTGEYLNGKYFYAKNMVLIDDCSLSNIEDVIHQMIEEGEFKEAFLKI